MSPVSAVQAAKRDFVSLHDLTGKELTGLLDLAARIKAEGRRGPSSTLLAGKTLGMIFRKPSLRTRVSFEVGMNQLGGHALYISDAEIGLGKRETVADVARVLSRFVDGILIRTFAHQEVVDLARWATVPVVNGLSDLLHPCQILGDLLTVRERRGTLQGVVVAFFGDGNNVAHSWIDAACRLPMELRIAVPKGFEPDATILARAREAGISKVTVLHDPAAAARGAHVLYTDVWASMGQETEAAERAAKMRPFQVNDALLAAADRSAIVLHCLPAHRGEEITDSVMEGRHSAVFDEAENRLHAQKAVLANLLGGAV